MSVREVPGLGNETVKLVDASTGNETVYLPAGYAVGRRLTVRRVDSSSNAVTVSLANASESLDGATNGSTIVGGNGEKGFLLQNPGMWESFGGVDPKDPALAASYALLGPIGRDALAAGGSGGAMKTLMAAISNRHFARCSILEIGDSTTEGQGATLMASRRLSRAQDALRSRFAVPGVAGGRGFIASHAVQTTFTLPVTKVGTTATDFTMGFGVRTVSLASSTSNGIDFAVNGTAVDIYWARSSGTGSFTWAVDGGATTTVATSGSTAGGNTTRVTFGSRGAHTVSIRWASGGTVYIEGVMEYDQDESAGITVVDSGHYGYTTGTFVNFITSGSLFWGAVSTLQPAAININLGLNDYSNQNVTGAQLKSYLQSLIAKLKTLCTVPPTFILTIPHLRLDVASPTISWSEYVSAYKAVASEDPLNVVVHDQGARLGDWSSSPAYFAGADRVHLSNQGQARGGDAFAAFIAAAA